MNNKKEPKLNKIDHEVIYFEFGAHFKYKDLCNRLEAMQNNLNGDRKIENVINNTETQTNKNSKVADKNEHNYFKLVNPKDVKRTTEILAIQRNKPVKVNRINISLKKNTTKDPIINNNFTVKNSLPPIANNAKSRNLNDKDFSTTLSKFYKSGSKYLIYKFIINYFSDHGYK